MTYSIQEAQKEYSTPQLLQKSVECPTVTAHIVSEISKKCITLNGVSASCILRILK